MTSALLGLTSVPLQAPSHHSASGTSENRLQTVFCNTNYVLFPGSAVRTASAGVFSVGPTHKPRPRIYFTQFSYLINIISQSVSNSEVFSSRTHWFGGSKNMGNCMASRSRVNPVVLKIWENPRQMGRRVNPPVLKIWETVRQMGEALTRWF